jgi:hypothetical protein
MTILGRKRTLLTAIFDTCPKKNQIGRQTWFRYQPLSSSSIVRASAASL